jgi:hypothetical protein
MQGNVPGQAQPEFDQGRLPSAAQISGIRMVFSPSATQQADIDALLAAQQDPNSPLYHQWITPAEYASRFGLSQNDLANVANWLQSQGFTINNISPAGNSIVFSGSAVEVEQAFRTEMHSYLVDGESHFANSTSPSLPASLSIMVVGIQGLHNFFPHAKSVQTPVAPDFTSSQSGNHYLAPLDFDTIYNVTPLNITGAGEKIAVVGQTAIFYPGSSAASVSAASNDIALFRAAAGLSAINLTIDCVSATQSYCTQFNTSDEPEADIDVEWSGAIAPSASIIFVTDPQNGVFNALEKAITTNVAPIISISYGTCEAYTTSGGVPLQDKTTATTLQNPYVQEANMQGETVIAAAGDDGAADCDTTTTSATHGLQADIPSDIPEVTAMGGTEFNGDVAASCTSGSCNATTYWTGTSGTDVVNSALSYIPEIVWNDDSLSGATTFSASGGGFSEIFAKPSWQTTLTTPADTAAGIVTTQRDVPDLALASSPNHDGYLICTQVFSGSTPQGSWCSSGFRNSSGNLKVYGGTSFAAPTFAGVLALIEQKASSTGYGNLNKTLYSLAAVPATYSSAFHDIITGNNMDPCTAPSQNCPAGTTHIGFTAGVGYDLASGLGSINATNLANALTLATTTTTVGFSPSTVTTGVTVTLTATVSPSTATGTVTFTIDGVTGSPVTLSSGVATTTTVFTTGGTHIISATYSGNSSYASSAGSTSISVSATGSATSTVTLIPSPASLVLGQSVTLNTTIISTTGGTVTGTVTYKIGTTTIGTAPVSSGASGQGTASDSITTSTALGFVVGANTVTATYSGNSTYAPSTGTTTVTITGVPYYSVSIAPMTIASTANGTTGTTTITLTSFNNYTGTITTPCTTATESYVSTSPNTLAYYFNCSAAINGTSTTSAALTANGTATVPFIIELESSLASAQTGAGVFMAQSPNHTTSRLSLYGGGAALAGLLFISLSTLRRRRLPALLCLLLFSMIFISTFAGMGCGNGTTSTPPSTTGINTAGSYTVYVTMVDANGVTEQGTFTLTLQ